MFSGDLVAVQARSARRRPGDGGDAGRRPGAVRHGRRSDTAADDARRWLWLSRLAAFADVRLVDTFPVTDEAAVSYRYSDRHRYGNCHCDGYRDRYGDRDRYGNCHRHSDRHSDRHCYGHCHGNCHCDRHRHRDGHGDGHRAAAHRGRGTASR